MIKKIFAKKTVSQMEENSNTLLTGFSPEESFQKAMEQHQMGNFSEAEVLYQQILQQQPDYPDALHFLGVMAYQLGNYDAAIELITKAIAVHPTIAMYSNLALVFQAQGNLEQLIKTYQQALLLEKNPAIYYNLANALAQQGDLKAAVASYQAGLALNPDDVEIHNQLGNAFLRLGDIDSAIASYRQVVLLKPDYGQVHNNLGTLLKEQNQLDQAVASYQQALALMPTYAPGYYNLAVTFYLQGKLDAAIENYQKSIALEPNYQACYNLGVIFQEQAQWPQAAESFQQTIALKADFAPAYHNLAVVLQKQKRLKAAIENYEKAIALKPEQADYHNLTAAFYESAEIEKTQGNLQAAIDYLQKIIALKPDHIDSLHFLGVLAYQQGNNQLAVDYISEAIKLNTVMATAQMYIHLGNAYKAQYDFDNAIENFKYALALDANNADAHYSLGVALHLTNKLEQAIACYRQAVTVNSTHIAAYSNLGLLLLSLGQYDEGWQLFEYRYHPDRSQCWTIPPKFNCPQWQGQSLVGKSLVVWTEQGFGDEIQFCRYASVLKQKGLKHLTWVCKKPLKPLFKTLAAVDNVLFPEEISVIAPHDYWTFPLSIPLHCKTTLENIPASIPYLYANSDDVKKIAVDITKITDFKVGICWKGSPLHENDTRRSPGIALFSSLFKLPKIKFFTLQPDTREEFIQNAGKNAVDRGHEIDKNSFEEAAALIENLDLVISCDTSICHLAGALGKPVWIVLPFTADWRWLIEREDSPWYPNSRLFRQTTVGDWHEVFQRIEQQLAQQIAEKTTGYD